MQRNSSQQSVQNTFKALADPTRRKILKHLSNRDMTIAEVTGQFDMTRAAVKKHLNILENGNLITVHQRGRERINRIEPSGLKSVSEWLSFFDDFWNERLTAMEAAIHVNEGEHDV